MQELNYCWDGRAMLHKENFDACDASLTTHVCVALCLDVDRLWRFSHNVYVRCDASITTRARVCLSVDVDRFRRFVNNVCVCVFTLTLLGCLSVRLFETHRWRYRPCLFSLFGNGCVLRVTLHLHKLIKAIVIYIFIHHNW